MTQISRLTARRYLLGVLGLWPGRRWSGGLGAAAAVRALGGVQVDPLNVAGRNHDLVLLSRVIGYQPEQLDALLYRERAFFDFGGLLFVYPMEELPYWRLHMRRQAEHPHRAAWASENEALLAAVRAELRARGPIGNRDFAGNARVTSYRARKDTGLALWHLWITGELMTHARRGFERLYGFADQIAPPADHQPTDAEAEAFFAHRAFSGAGIRTAGQWRTMFAYFIQRRVEPAEGKQWIERLVAEGAITPATIEGLRETYYLPAADAPLLDELERDGVPRAWQPLSTTTHEEVTLLAPLDPLLDRRLARSLFDFEYIWEVYKPAAQRRWGYYTLPILYRDRLAARLDPKLDRKSGTLAMNGFWLEDKADAHDPEFGAALARGIARFARFHQARRIDADALPAGPIREVLGGSLDLGDGA